MGDIEDGGSDDGSDVDTSVTSEYELVLPKAMEANSTRSLTPRPRSPSLLTRHIPPAQVQSTALSLTDASHCDGPPRVSWFVNSPLSRATPWKGKRVHIPIPIHIPSPDRTVSQQEEYEAERKAWLQEYRAVNNLEDPSQSSRQYEGAATQDTAWLESVPQKADLQRALLRSKHGIAGPSRGHSKLLTQARKDRRTPSKRDRAREKAIELSKQIDLVSSLRASLVRKQKRLLKIPRLCELD